MYWWKAELVEKSSSVPSPQTMCQLEIAPSPMAVCNVSEQFWPSTIVGGPSSRTAPSLAVGPVTVLPGPLKTVTGVVTLGSTMMVLLPPGVLTITDETAGNEWLLIRFPSASVMVTVTSPVVASCVIVTWSLAREPPPNT